MQPTPIFWPGEFHGLYTVHGVTNSRTQLSNFHFLCIWDTFMINLRSDSTDLSDLNSVVLEVQSASQGCD